MTGRDVPPRAVAVVDAAGASDRDAAAIAAGIPSRALMQRAGAAAAGVLSDAFSELLPRGALIATGPGNNGGDGWVVAHALHAAGVDVLVAECAQSRTPDALAERDAAIGAGVRVAERTDALPTAGGRLIVDALLGTGVRAGALLGGSIGDAVAQLRAMREAGACVVALDLPSGLDATSGHDAGAVRADLTITFGTIKRGHLVARALCGRIVVVDIGLGAHAHHPGETELASPAWFRAHLPRIAADAHKGTRGKVAIVGGAPGMAGAVMLAARGALRSGAGLVKCLVAPESLGAVQEGEPAALGAAWPATDDAMRAALAGWADVVLVGPGLGAAHARALMERVLAAFDGPVVLDADALNAFAGHAHALCPLIGHRAALLTPHPAEFARLAGIDVAEVLARRFELPARMSRDTGAAVLLKGVPTVVASVAGEMRCVAEGTPLLATGGVGDILGGIAATLLAQTGDAALSGALAAFAHGRAAHAVSARQVRGFTLNDMLAELPGVWSLPVPAPYPPLLADLPLVGESDG